jgi:hypothetical protein
MITPLPLFPEEWFKHGQFAANTDIHGISVWNLLLFISHAYTVTLALRKMLEKPSSEICYPFCLPKIS